jgi:argininosuccinate lyase
MPQKKNPDMAELVRGKTGRVTGHLVALLTLLKGLPLAYNRDLQEDKEALFDAAETLRGSLEVMTGVVGSLSFRPERLAAAASIGFSSATDLAEYLALAGVPFRQAHGIVGRIVRHCIENRKDLGDLTLAEFREFSPKFGPDVLKILTPEASVRLKRGPGSTAPVEVKKSAARGAAPQPVARCVGAPQLDAPPGGFYSSDNGSLEPLHEEGARHAERTKELHPHQHPRPDTGVCGAPGRPITWISG